MTDYNNRQDFEMDHWPELRTAFKTLVKTVQADRELPRRFKSELFTMASLASGCVHCQSHGAFNLNAMGVETERIRAIWEYETSDLFSDAERAALDLVGAAAQIPNATTPEHFVNVYGNESKTKLKTILSHFHILIGFTFFTDKFIRFTFSRIVISSSHFHMFVNFFHLSCGVGIGVFLMR